MTANATILVLPFAAVPLALIVLACPRLQQFLESTLSQSEGG